MKKVTKSMLELGGVLAVAWWLGGMMYFILVAKHFRDKETHEDASKNTGTDTVGINCNPGGDVSAHDGAERNRKPTQYPYPNWIKQSDDSKWRSYYQPSAGRNPGGLRPGETGWDN